ncbi:MAG: molybdenum cofactor biosynthesis protein MoaE [Nevskiales bacterium]
MTTHLTESALNIENLLTATAGPEAGALVVFGGTVRNLHEGRAVQAMSYTAYAPLAEKTLAEIEREAQERFDITQCRIVHRLGELALGELSVLVVVRAAHRDTAFAAARWAIDTLKQRVPIWKEEHYEDGASAHLEGVELNLPSCHSEER